MSETAGALPSARLPRSQGSRQVCEPCERETVSRSQPRKVQNMNTHTTQDPRALARPSRLRVLRARVIAWHDEHRDALALVLVAVTAVALVAFSALALIGDGAPVGYTWQGAFASLAVAFIVGALAYFIGDEAGAARARDNGGNLVRVMTRDMGDEIARLTRERDDLAAALSATQADARTAQDEARRLRTEPRRANDDHAPSLRLAFRTSYWLDRYTTTVSVGGVDIASGHASDDKHANATEQRRAAFLDALDNAAFELSVAASVLGNGEAARAAGLTANAEVRDIVRALAYRD